MTVSLLRRAGAPGAPAIEGGPGGPPPAGSWLGVRDLLAVARGLARNARMWPEVAAGPDRAWDLMMADHDLEAWVVGWPPGGAIELHDHGASAGAVVVVRGTLLETAVVHDHGELRAREERLLGRGDGVGFDPGRVHDVVNTGARRALSVHVYAPPLSTMTFYRVAAGRLAVDRTEHYRAAGDHVAGGPCR